MNIIKSLLLTALLLFLSACSSINLHVAQDLAENGSETSLNIAESYSKRRDNLEFYLEGEQILSALKKGYSLPGEKSVAKVDSLKKEMLKRKEMFAELASVYGAFAGLAVYEDDGNIETSLRNLTSAVNDYSKLKTGKIYFSQSDEDLIAITGAKLFEAYHNFKVRQASEIIRTRLEAIKELLQKESEKEAVIAMEKEIDRNRLKVALAMWDIGLGLPNAIIAEHIEAYGLQFNKSTTIRQTDRTTTGKMKTAIENVLRFRHERGILRRKEAYNASIHAIQSLITVHRQLENGQRLSLNSLRSLMKTVNEYTTLVGSR